MFRFIFTVLVVVGVLAGTVFFFLPQPSFLFQTSFFLGFATIVIYGYLHRVVNPEDFVRLYLGMVALKLMVCLGYAAVMAMKDQPGIVNNIVYFLVVYFVLTGLEVGFLYRNRNR